MTGWRRAAAINRQNRHRPAGVFRPAATYKQTMAKTDDPRRLPRAGERINRDPLRRLGDVPARWRCPGRLSAVILATFDDGDIRVLLLKWWSAKRKAWLYRAMDEGWWESDSSWEIGPLPREPRR